MKVAELPKLLRRGRRDAAIPMDFIESAVVRCDNDVLRLIILRVVPGDAIDAAIDVCNDVLLNVCKACFSFPCLL